MMKWILGVVVLVIAGVALWWSGWLGNIGMATPQTQTQPTDQQTAQNTQPQSDLPTASNDASDGALVQDLAAVDLQMQNLTNDSANIDQSLNDKPVAQDY